MHSSVTLSTFTILCGRRHCLVAEILRCPRWELHAHYTAIPHPALPLSASGNNSMAFCHYRSAVSVCFIWMNSYSMWPFVSCFSNFVFKVHHFCSMHQFFISFDGWIIFHCVNASHFVYLVICWCVCGLSSPCSDCEQCCCEQLCISFCLNMNAFFWSTSFSKTQVCVFAFCQGRGARCATALQMPKQRACPLVILFSSLFSCLLIISSCFLSSLLPAQIYMYMWVLPNSDNLEFILADGFPLSVEVIFFK